MVVLPSGRPQLGLKKGSLAQVDQTSSNKNCAAEGQEFTQAFEDKYKNF
jgi:hypothetical protein